MVEPSVAALPLRCWCGTDRQDAPLEEKLEDEDRRDFVKWCVEMVEKELTSSGSLQKATRAFSEKEMKFGSRSDLNSQSKKGLFASSTDDADSADEFYATEVAEEATSSATSSPDSSTSSAELEKAKLDLDAAEAKLSDAAAMAQMSLEAQQQLRQEAADKQAAMKNLKEQAAEAKKLKGLAEHEMGAVRQGWFVPHF